MKKITLILTLLFSFTVCFSQQPAKQVVDTSNVADTVAIISVQDMKNVLQYLEDKVSKKEWDAFEKAYGVLLQATEQKRRKKK